MQNQIVIAIATFFLATPSLHANDQVDRDADGIADQVDFCLETPENAKIWKTGEWTGCAGGQTRNNLNWLATQIRNCEARTDDRIESIRIYAGTRCSTYAYQYNASTQPYVNLARSHGRAVLENLGAARLNQRLSLCLQVERNSQQVVDAMVGAGCGSNEGYSGSYEYESGGYSQPSATGSNESESPAQPSNTEENQPTGYSAAGTYVRNGHVTVSSNGETYISNGHVTTSSSGETFITNGNVTTSSSGETFITSGNVTFGSNGTTCITNGSITTCN